MSNDVSFSSYNTSHPYSWVHCYPDWGYFPKSLFKDGSIYQKSGIRVASYYDYTTHTLANILSYIPVINIVVGVIRLFVVINEPPSDKTRRNLQILRGFSDIILGPLNAIIDAIVTLARVIIANSRVDIDPSLAVQV